MKDLQKEILKIENLTKEFTNSNGSKIVALNNVSFSLYKNETLGIVGESGSGKSTLAKILAKIYEQSSGNVIINGKNCNNISGKELREYLKNMQMVFQNPLSVFSPRMSIREFLCEGLINYKIKNKKEAEEEMKKYLEAVEMSEEFLDRLPHELSGGQLQRIVIARAISVLPDIIIYDEATAALDVSVQEKILRLIYEIQKKMNLTAIFICHDLSTVRLVSDRMIVMFKGEIVEIIDSENLTNAIHPYTKELLECIFDLNETKNTKAIELHSEKMLDDIVEGCPYKNRCKYKMDICENNKPTLHESPFGFVSCFK